MKSYKLYSKLLQSTNYIPIKQLKAGVTYRIIARNAFRGIWIPEEQGFVISRNKYGRIYPFVEYHWDSHPCYGTAKPFEIIEQSPFRRSEILSILSENKTDHFHTYLRSLEEDEDTLLCLRKYI